MPILIRIDPLMRLVFTTAIGEINENDFQAAVVRLPHESGFDPAFSHIIDFSGVTAAHISTEFVKNLARQPSLFSPTAVQVVVAPQSHIFGLARMAQILREQRFSRVEVVQSLNEAYEILGLKGLTDR